MAPHCSATRPHDLEWLPVSPFSLTFHKWNKPLGKPSIWWASWDTPSRDGQLPTSHILFLVVYFSDGACSNPYRGHGWIRCQWGMGHNKTRMGSGPCVTLTIRRGQVTPQPYYLNLSWFQGETSFLLSYLCSDVTRTDRQNGAFQIWEVCPPPVSCLVWL